MEDSHINDKKTRTSLKKGSFVKLIYLFFSILVIVLVNLLSFIIFNNGNKELANLLFCIQPIFWTYIFASLVSTGGYLLIDKKDAYIPKNIYTNDSKRFLVSESKFFSRFIIKEFI